MKGNVSESSITQDLEAMKRKGFAGLLMFDARGYHEGHVPPPPSRMEFMSPEWRRMLKFAMSEANRLGLEMSVNLSSCAGALKGHGEVNESAALPSWSDASKVEDGQLIFSKGLGLSRGRGLEPKGKGPRHGHQAEGPMETRHSYDSLKRRTGSKTMKPGEDKASGLLRRDVTGLRAPALPGDSRS